MSYKKGKDMKLIGLKLCPYVQRVASMMVAKGLKYDVEYITKEDKPEWFLKISPNGKVPMLITNHGTALFESDALVEYINEISAPFLPEQNPEERALDRAWSALGTQGYGNQYGMFTSKTEEEFTEKQQKFHQTMAMIEPELKENSKFFHGDILSNVDVTWSVLLRRANLVAEMTGLDLLKDFPKAKKWQETLLHSGLSKALAEDFPERFKEYYINENTYLGNIDK